MDMNRFTEFGLSEDIIEALSLLGYLMPTEIQGAVIPRALCGQDIIGKSKTGSGKTAAFAIPVCEAVVWEDNLPQAIVLEPTRELAYQVKDEIFNIGRMKRINVPVVFGGFSFEKQANTLKQKSHIVVGTPGRVLEHCQMGTLKCEQVKYIIIDEADLMLDMGFIDEVKQIFAFMPERKVTLLFSATMSDSLYSLADEFMNKPLEIKLESDTETVDRIVQEGYFVEEEDKFDLFLKVLYKENPKSGIIFCGTREMAEVLYYKLKKEQIMCGVLHGLIDQRQRIRTIEKFRSKGFRYLIATDVAARGVDFEKITHVFNYDLPTSKETYVHRIGRTGRNQSDGKAISLIKQDEIKMYRAIEQFTQAPIKICSSPKDEETSENKIHFEETQHVKQRRQKKKGDVFKNQIMKLSIGGGRKSKLRAGDVVGTIAGIDGINANEDIGVIEIRDSMTYVEILNGKGNRVLEELPKRTMKGKYRKVNRVR
ncbi:ATP-dependent RNA helicase YxiN [Lachnospiraceae bacterium KM106-2]|nr:ATP-dependent RNA helicase YxiN [Lachnospiraceae bacterium KM106-2]